MITAHANTLLSRLSLVYLGTLIMLSCSTVAYGQQEDDREGQLQDAEVLIEKNRQIILNEEEKIVEYIQYQPKNQSIELPEDGFKAYEYNRKEAAISYDAPEVADQAKSPIYKQHVLAGIGNYLSPVLKVNLVTPTDPDRVLGLKYEHFSFATGPIDDRNSGASYNDLKLYGIGNFEQISIRPYLSYRHDRNYYYGYVPSDQTPRRDSIRRAFGNFELGIKLVDNLVKDELDYAIGLAFGNQSDNYDNSENQFTLDGTLSINKQINLKSLIKSTKLNSSDTSLNRSYYRILPYYTLNLGELSADLGISLNGQNDDLVTLNKTRIFPYIDAKYNLTKQYAAFAKLDAGYNFNTLASQSMEVPYLTPNINIQNSKIAYDLQLGVSGKPMDKLMIMGYVGLSQINNLQTWVNDSTYRSWITPVYDNGKTDILNIGLTASYFINKQHELKTTLDLYSYNTDKLDDAYHLPTMRLTTTGHHQIIDRLMIQWKLTMLGGLKAYDHVLDKSVKLDLIPRADVMVHYQIIPQAGAFISFDNLLSQSYQRFYHYPERGIVFRIGGTYRF